MDKIPDNQPLIIVVNHPTAFAELVFIASATSKARNTMLRGDMFGKGRIIAEFFKIIRCIPIYRAQDGMANLKKNESILEYCYQLLNKGDNLFIAAEGDSKYEKRLRPIQKGAARMAFGAYEKYGRKDIAVLPVGFNFSDSNEFRSKIYADFGEPIPISDYFEDYEKNPRRAVKLLTDKIALELRKRIIHVAKTEEDDLANKILKVAENSQMAPPLPIISTKPSRLFSFIAMIERLNGLEEGAKIKLEKKVNHYFSLLEKFNIKDIGVAQIRYYGWATTFALVVGFLPFLVGTVANFIPITTAKAIADKKAQEIKFRASTQIGLGAVLYGIYLLLLLIIVGIWANIWYFILVLLFPAFGHFAAIWMDYARKWYAAWKVRRLGQDTIMELRKWRVEVKI